MIESEPTSVGEPMFDNHLQAVALVCERAAAGERALGPRTIHRTIMGSAPDAHPGEYRDVWVSVGGEIKISPALVPARMAALLRRARQRDTAEAIWDTHLEFEAIHPFRDGNGRSGRVWVNELLLRAGHPWRTVMYGARFEYYQEIRRWEMVQRLLVKGVDASHQSSRQWPLP